MKEVVAVRPVFLKGTVYGGSVLGVETIVVSGTLDEAVELNLGVQVLLQILTVGKLLPFVHPGLCGFERFDMPKRKAGGLDTGTELGTSAAFPVYVEEFVLLALCQVDTLSTDHPAT